MIRIVTALLFLIAATAAADVPRTIGWGDLIPETEPLENPFEAIPYEVREDVATIARIRADQSLGFITLDSPEMQQARDLQAALLEQGYDADAILAKADALAGEIDRRNAALVPALDGVIIKMPGYALPLEFADTGVREFLLVPYVGACIHEPPPPVNQTVFVDFGDGYVMDDLYAPVWVIGRIRTKASSQSLSFVDGVADVQTGYTIEAIAVEPYQ